MCELGRRAPAPDSAFRDLRSPFRQVAALASWRGTGHRAALRDGEECERDHRWNSGQPRARDAVLHLVQEPGRLQIWSRSSSSPPCRDREHVRVHPGGDAGVLGRERLHHRTEKPRRTRGVPGVARPGGETDMPPGLVCEGDPPAAAPVSTAEKAILKRISNIPWQCRLVNPDENGASRRPRQRAGRRWAGTKRSTRWTRLNEAGAARNMPLDPTSRRPA